MRKFVWVALSSLSISASLSAAHYYCDTCDDRMIADHAGGGHYQGGYYRGGRSYQDGYRGRPYYRDNYNYQDDYYPYYYQDQYYYNMRPYDADYDRNNFDEDQERAERRNRNTRGHLSDNTSSQAQKIHNSDHALMTRVQFHLERGPARNKFKNVNVRVSDGVVTLTGTVENAQDQQMLKHRVQGTPGVKSVNDQTEIKSSGAVKPKGAISYYDDDEEEDEDFETSALSSTKRNSDRQLNLKIQDTLKSGAFKENFADIEIEVSHGNVTLSGSVDTEEDSREAEKRVRNINGIKNVDNQIQVQSSKLTK